MMFHKSSIFTATSAAIVSACLLLGVGSATAQEKTSYVGPSIGINNSGNILYGVNAKFKVADSISVRPYIQFLSKSFGDGFNASATYYGVSATYDFSIPQSNFQPYAGIGYFGTNLSGSGSVGSTASTSVDSGIYLELGSDYNISDVIALNVNYKSRNGGGYFSFGGAYRF